MALVGFASIAFALLAGRASAAAPPDLEGWRPVGLEGRKFVPIWSPDGGRLAFAVEEAGRITGPWMLDLATRKIARIESREGFTASGFFGDGSLIGFGRAGDTSLLVRWGRAGEVSELRRLPGSHAVYPSMSRRGDLAWLELDSAHASLRVLPAGAERVQRFDQLAASFNGRPPSWSADGRSLVVGARVGGDPEVVRLRLDAGAIERLTRHPGADFNPSLSPDGRWIAFIRGEPGARESSHRIYLMGADGSGARQLGEISPIHGSLSFSPDGRWLAFNGFADGGVELFAVRIADGLTRRLTSSKPDGPLDGDWHPLELPGHKFMPIWSPDGGRLTFVQEIDGRFRGPWLLDLARHSLTLALDGDGFSPSGFTADGRAILGHVSTGDDRLVRLEPGGEVVTRRSELPGLLLFPAPSPDGRRIAWLQRGGPGWRLVVGDSAGGDASQPGDPAVSYGGAPPSWSRESDALFVCAKLDGDPEVVRLRLADGEQLRLTDHPGRDFNPSLSPDGRTIAFIRGEPGVEEDELRIFLMAPDGSAVRRLGDVSPLHGSLSWSSDGRWIAFNSLVGRAVELFAIRVDDGRLVQLTEGG